MFLLSTEIQKLVLEGRVGEAIETTQRFYPGLLEHNPNLLFMLKYVLDTTSFPIAQPLSAGGGNI